MEEMRSRDIPMSAILIIEKRRGLKDPMDHERNFEGRKSQPATTRGNT
jgi:hypothetical protein